MNDKELKVERCRLDIKTAESRLREAIHKAEEGYKISQSKVEQAKAEMERDYAVLKEEVDRSRIQLELEKAYLKNAQADLERGFDSQTSN